MIHTTKLKPYKKFNRSVRIYKIVKFTDSLTIYVAIIWYNNLFSLLLSLKGILIPY